jgi:putative FmdB family regulatory protein
VPVYDYRCSSCDNVYETREGFDAPSTQSCPRCGGLARRVLYAPPIVFKGSGFYVTDNRNDRGNGGSSLASTTSSSGSESASTSEPAPASTD